MLVYAVFSHGPIPTWSGINRTAGIIGFFLLAWDYYLWRIPWSHPKIVPHPNIRGTWRGVATIFHLPSEPPASDGITRVPVDFERLDGYMIFRQTGSGFKLTALWGEDKYTSIMKHFAPITGADGRGVFVGEYENRAGMVIGVAGIVIHTTAHPEEARFYYTTVEPVPQRGLVVLSNRVRQFCNTWDEARDLPLDARRSLRQKLRFILLPW